jgi:N-acetylmuramate 1-kinase
VERTRPRVQVLLIYSHARARAFRFCSVFMSDFRQRLEQFLIQKKQPSEIEQLTPDASTREYFRVNRRNKAAIACVYPESFVASEQTYLDVTNLFRRGNLPVAEIYDFDESLGVIVLEDFGDTILREVLLKSDETTREKLLDEAIRLIAKIQAATPLAFELDSIASRLKFDEEKLLWELDFFKEHYFTSLKKQPLSIEDEQNLNAEFIELVRELEAAANVLTHRDFHAANLMLDDENNLQIIDHQDARIGAASYDLVSILLDRVTTLPSSEWLAEKRAFFLAEREKLGLAFISETDFTNEFRLQTIQRCLKAIGTFSFQTTFRSKNYFLPFIKPMFEIVLRAAQNLDRFPTLQKIIGEQINDKNS